MIDALDPRQIVRIESVHRGFLYQHLYAAGCLLLAGNNGIQVIGVERDEDIELETASDRRLYVQVKTRSSPLVCSDIAGALLQFEAIRGEHHAARRPGGASFFIVSNIAPGPELRRKIENADIAADVRLVWPGAPAVGEACLPPAWADIPAAARWRGPDPAVATMKGELQVGPPYGVDCHVLFFDADMGARGRLLWRGGTLEHFSYAKLLARFSPLSLYVAGTNRPSTRRPVTFRPSQCSLIIIPGNSGSVPKANWPSSI